MFHIDTNDLIDHMHRPDPQCASHLKVCAECSADLQLLLEIKAAFRDVIEVPEGYCQLDAAEADLGQRVTKSSQAAVAAFHSLKERSRNSR